MRSRAGRRGGLRLGRGRSCWSCRRLRWGVGLAYQLDIEDEVGFRGDSWGTAGFAVGQLPGDEEAAFASYVHALEAAVPAGNDAVDASGEGDGFATGMVVGGVEFGAVGEPAGVADCVEPDLRLGLAGAQNAGLGEGAGADVGVYVLEGIEGFGEADNFGDVGGGLGCGGGGGVVRGGVGGGGGGGGLGGCGGGEGGQDGNGGEL